jgi:hypothetical protein
MPPYLGQIPNHQLLSSPQLINSVISIMDLWFKFQNCLSLKKYDLIYLLTPTYQFCHINSLIACRWKKWQPTEYIGIFFDRLWCA